MKIAVISIASPEYKPLSDVTYPHWQRYCEKHGYDFISDVPKGGRGVAWQKLSMIAETLREYDFVLWVGADTIPTNSDIAIEDFWKAQGKPKVLLSADVFGINSDVMLFARCAESEMFLYAINHIGFHLYQNHRWQEQEAIIRFAHQKPYCDSVKIIPQKGFNSYMHRLYGRPEYWPGNWERGDWILHLPGLSNDRRISVIKELEAAGDIQ